MTLEETRLVGLLNYRPRLDFRLQLFVYVGAFCESGGLGANWNRHYRHTCGHAFELTII
jgi:hypothetical protein